MVLKWVLSACVCIAVAASAGCGPGHTLTLAEAQRLATAQNKEVVVYYKAWQSAECSTMQRHFNQQAVRQAMADKVLCILLEDYDPHRRFVARFGVERPPAVILIHRDQTYHARVGRMDAPQIVNFLMRSQPPGLAPR